MSRRPLHAALSLAVTWASWTSAADVTPARAQSPATAQNQPVQTLTVAEPGRPPEKCVLLQMWQLDDGSPAMKVRSLATGEIMTVVEPVHSNATKDRFQVYRWGKSVVPPAGSPMPPPETGMVEPDAAGKKWPSAHETIVKSRPSAGTRLPTKAGQDSRVSEQRAATGNNATASAKRAPVAAARPQTEATRASSTSAKVHEVTERTKASEPPKVTKAESPAKLAAGLPAPSSPTSAAMDRNPAVPASAPVPPPIMPPVSPPASVEPPKQEPVKVAKGDAPDSRSVEAPAPMTAPSEAGTVSRSKPAMSVLPPEPPTPIVPVSAPNTRPAATARASETAKDHSAETGSSIDNGHVVSRTTPALPATAIQVVPRRTGPDPLANPDQYVRLNKRERDEREEQKPVSPRSAPEPVARAAVKEETAPARHAAAAPSVAKTPVAPELKQPTAPSVSPVENPTPVTHQETARTVPPPVGPLRIDMPTGPTNKAAAENRPTEGTPVIVTPPERAVAQSGSPEKNQEAIEPPAMVEPMPPQVEPPTGTLISVAPTRPWQRAEKSTAAVQAPAPPAISGAPRVTAARPTMRPQGARAAEQTKAVAATPPVRPDFAASPVRQEQRSFMPVEPAPVPEPMERHDVRQASLAAPASALSIKPLPHADLGTLQGMVEMLKVLSDSGVPAHRQEAARRLGGVEPTAHPYVVEALASTAKKDGMGQVRVAAIKALQQMRADSKSVRAALQDALADADPRVRHAANEALRTLPAPSTPFIQPVSGFTQ